MARKTPSADALLAARLARAYPALSTYSAASLAAELCAIERAQRRHAVRCCAGEDGGYVRVRSLAREDDCAGSPIVREHDPEAEARAAARIDHRIEEWYRRLSALLPEGLESAPITTDDDPRGAVLKIRLPGEAEAVAV